MAETNILLESGTNELEIIEFKLGFEGKQGFEEQSFGINVGKVREIIRMPKLTKLPNLNPNIVGVFNLREKIIPALDLGYYLYGIPNVSSKKKMIIAEFNRMSCGFIVDDVSRIHRISWKDIVSPDAISDFENGKMSITGFIRMGNVNLLLLDVEKIVVDIDPKVALNINEIVAEVDWSPKILIAEDSPVIRKMIVDKLKYAGFEVKDFGNGQDAWDYFIEVTMQVNQGAKLSDFVDIVISDIEMPMMDGYTLTKLIKTDPRLNKLPVILFSSLINDDVIHKGKSVGADYQITKPQLSELITYINQFLKN